MLVGAQYFTSTTQKITCFCQPTFDNMLSQGPPPTEAKNKQYIFETPRCVPAKNGLKTWDRSLNRHLIPRLH